MHVKRTENGHADGPSHMPVRVLGIGLVGKEQSYPSAMAVVCDDSGGFLLKEKRGRDILEYSGCSVGSGIDEICNLKSTGKRSGTKRWFGSNYSD